ncbi:hypothetical protein SH467x_000274 [Pirellulaceae bacterium SH467]
MRFIQFRQLLRGLLAASLAIAGTSADIAFAGIQNTRWNQVCFLNDREYDLWESGFSGDPLSCTLEGAAWEFELDDCIRADRFQLDRQVAFSLLHHHLPRLHCSAWIHGFRTTGDGLGTWLTRQYELGRAAGGQLSKIALAVGTVSPSISAPAVDGLVGASFPERELDGNLFVYVFEEELASPVTHSEQPNEDQLIAEQPSAEQPSGEQLSGTQLVADGPASPALVANFDSCFAESHFANAIPAIQSGITEESVASEIVTEPHSQQPVEELGQRPPVLEGDQLALVEKSSEPDSCMGLGHCTIPGSETPALEPVSTEIVASEESVMLRDWIAPDWNIRTWELRTHGPRYEYKLEGFAAKPMFPPEGLVLDYAPSSSAQSGVEESLVEESYTEAPLVEDTYIDASPFEAWFSTAWNSMVTGVYDRLTGWEPAAQELSVQSTRIVSRKLKHLGMLLIQSADRLDQAAIPIGIAGRAGTQR